MPNYSLTRYNTGVKDTFAEALEALETQMETVDDAKTIYQLEVRPTGRDRDQAIGIALYAT